MSASDDTRESDPGRGIATPYMWLLLAVAGLLLLCAGVAIAAYRSDGESVGVTSPGGLMAAVGIVLIAVGVLAAGSLVLLQSARSLDTAVRRIVIVVVAWTSVGAALVATATYVETQDLRIGTAPAASVQAPGVIVPSASSTPAPLPGESDRVALNGAVTLDGAPLEAKFLGADVMRDGLRAACTVEIAQVIGGQYQVHVIADAEVLGCGAPGGSIMLWTSVGNRYLWSRETLAWPGGGATAAFDATFSTTDPDGAHIPATEFFGEVHHRDGSAVAGGTAIEAYIGSARCGRGSVRLSGFTGYNLSVAGPELPGCALDAAITFRVGGRPARETATNDLGRDADAQTIDLTVD